MSRSDDPGIAQNPPAAPRAPRSEGDNLGPEDYYFEGPNLVFTEAYHLKRGSCCGSGCRHCPYGQSGSRTQSTSEIK